ncbi:MAG: hypothetical protein Q9192_000858 [Flavoplaca navasiana]
MTLTYITLLATLLTILAATASCKSINCEGNSECDRGGATAASRLIHAAPDDRWFNNKQQIARVPAGSDPNPDSAQLRLSAEYRKGAVEEYQGVGVPDHRARVQGLREPALFLSG